MPRPLRTQFENAYYHVYNRGVEKRNIFLEERDYGFFMNKLGEAAVTFGVNIFAYCLMTNHFHLFIQTPHTNLDRFMRESRFSGSL